MSNSSPLQEAMCMQKNVESSRLPKRRVTRRRQAGKEDNYCYDGDRLLQWLAIPQSQSTMRNDPFNWQVLGK